MASCIISEQKRDIKVAVAIISFLTRKSHMLINCYIGVLRARVHFTNQSNKFGNA